jgi:DNA-binding transcriptional LysR family regulator
MNLAALGIELTHLRYFVAVAEELHFGRAAKRLSVSQPPLTQQIQKLEQRIGFALFARSTRRTELTAAGAAMLPEARAALEAAERSVEMARRAGRGETGRLTLATPPSVMLAGLPKIVRTFRRKLPGVEVELREMATAAIGEAVARGSADLGFLRSPVAPEGLREHFRFRERVAVILPRGHRLAGSRRVRLAQLAGDAFVFFPARLGPEFHAELLGLCRAEGFEPRVVQEATQWSTVVALVEAGLGVTIAPEPVCRLGGRGCVWRRVAGAVTTVLLVSGEEVGAVGRRCLAMDFGGLVAG